MSAEEPSVNPPPGQPASFETALEKLEALVRELESGNVPLDKSIEAYEEGQRLIKYCEGKLAEAEKALTQLAREADETLGKEYRGDKPSN